jgi:hemerythrin-like domain-containing protein
MPETPPDTRLYYWVHRAMRISSAQLHAALVGLRPHDRSRARAIAWWFEGFKGELAHHHTLEDTVFFPALTERVPTFAHHGPELAADHEHLDLVLERLSLALAVVAAGEDVEPSLADAVRFAAELAEHLDRHLAVEDQDVVPLFERHLTADEYEVLDARAKADLAPKQALFTVPWTLSYLDDAERRVTLDGAPLPLRLVWYAMRRRYARRAALALGTGASLVEVR